MDLLEHLRDKACYNKNAKLKANYDKFLQYREKDFSEIFLFFDYDFHFKNMKLENWNEHLKTMLDFFNEETDNGKLYINYPMVESIRYTKQLPDANYHSYTVKRSDCCKFKNMASSFSEYTGLAFIQLTDAMDNDGKKAIKQNWEYLIQQNVAKANCLCFGKNDYPTKKVELSQMKIFLSQLKDYVYKEECCVSILNAFPLFLYDYFNF